MLFRIWLMNLKLLMKLIWNLYTLNWRIYKMKSTIQKFIHYLLCSREESTYTSVYGFLRRIWKNHNIDKVVLLKKGMFLVRFKCLEDIISLIINMWYWNRGRLRWILRRKILRHSRFRMQLKLNLKYWGEKYLHKIVSQLSDPIKKDDATRNRDKIQSARILIEVKIDQKFPDSINFWNENEELTKVH